MFVLYIKEDLGDVSYLDYVIKCCFVVVVILFVFFVRAQN